MLLNHLVASIVVHYGTQKATRQFLCFQLLFVCNKTSAPIFLLNLDIQKYRRSFSLVCSFSLGLLGFLCCGNFKCGKIASDNNLGLVCDDAIQQMSKKIDLLKIYKRVNVKRLQD